MEFPNNGGYFDEAAARRISAQTSPALLPRMRQNATMLPMRPQEEQTSRPWRIESRNFSAWPSQVNLPGQPLTQQETYNRLREQLFPNQLIPARRMAAPLPRQVRRSQESRRNVATMHPSFRSKTVCQLGCNFCRTSICKRGMKAILLADTSVELYSTDNVNRG